MSKLKSVDPISVDLATKYVDDCAAALERVTSLATSTQADGNSIGTVFFAVASQATFDIDQMQKVISTVLSIVTPNAAPLTRLEALLLVSTFDRHRIVEPAVAEARAMAAVLLRNEFTW